jgi:hypothetical protein
MVIWPPTVETKENDQVTTLDLDDLPDTTQDDFDNLRDITQENLDQMYLERMKRIASIHHDHLIQSIEDAQRQGICDYAFENSEEREHAKFLQEHKNKLTSFIIGKACMFWTKYSPNPTDGQEIKQHTTDMPSTDIPSRQDGILSPSRSREEAERMYQHLKDHPYSVVWTKKHGITFVKTNPIEDNQPIQTTEFTGRLKERWIESAMKGGWIILYQPFQRNDGWLSKMSVATLPFGGSLSKKTEEEAKIMLQHLKTNIYARVVIFTEKKNWVIAIVSQEKCFGTLGFLALHSTGDKGRWTDMEHCLNDAMIGKWAFLLP